MDKSFVRIEKIEMNKFKNVTKGVLDFHSTKENDSASVLGLYGQNGSGKTALIEAFKVLKMVLSGKNLPLDITEYINVDSDYSHLKFEFSVFNDDDGKYNVNYEFKIKKDINISIQNTEINDFSEKKYKTTIFDEILSYSYNGDGKNYKLSPVVDTRNTDAFLPATKYEALVGRDKKTETSILVARKYAEATSRSFIFGAQLLNLIKDNCKEEYHKFLFRRLVRYGNFELFVIDTKQSGLIQLDNLPISFKYRDRDREDLGSILLNLNGTTKISSEAYNVVKKVIGNMNIVLKQLVPDLTIDIVDLGTEIVQNGGKVNNIQMVSRKNNNTIPLKYESEGIKRIISVLHLLIFMYNKKSITVAIDELDSGIFEFLLGELLRIISEKGKGQLIFTSHNLRPLETINRKYIAFTTVNPEKRYIRLTNVKTNNNLRDFYFRDIMLGEQSEDVYKTTDNSEIAFAFRKAGEVIGS